MKHTLKIYLFLSFLYALNAYSKVPIIDTNNDISYELREVFGKVGIEIPEKDILLDILKKNFGGAPNFNDKDLNKIREEFSLNLRLDEKKCAEILSDLYKIFGINQAGFIITPEVDIALSGTSGPDVMLQKMAKLKTLEEAGELTIKEFVFITNDSYIIMDRFRIIENLKKIMWAYDIKIKEDVVMNFLEENKDKKITHQQAFENIVMLGTELGDFFEGRCRWSTFNTQYNDTTAKYKEYFEFLSGKPHNVSIVAIENSFLQDNAERNQLIFRALKETKNTTHTNNIQFTGMIVAGPILDNDGYIDIEREMAAHLSNPAQTIMDLFVLSLRKVALKN